MFSLGVIGFTLPWALLGLLALPLVWWLLRLTPPTPRSRLFPPLRILRGLIGEEETPASSPWWLLLLRLTIAALAILALAGPVLNPDPAARHDRPLLVIVDDGWAAAANWQRRQEMLAALLRGAARDKRAVALLATAPTAAQGSIAAPRLMRAEAALKLAEALVPKPWPVDHVAAAKALAAARFTSPPLPVWLSDGLTRTGTEELLFAANRLDLPRVVLEPGPSRAKALIPKSASSAASGFEVLVRRTAGPDVEQLMVRVTGEGGRLLDRRPLTLAAGESDALVRFEIPANVRNSARRIDIEGQHSAGSVILLDENWRRRPVGIITAESRERQDQPLLSSIYYLERALDPFADVHTGPLEELAEMDLSVLILADIGTISESQQKRLTQWIDAGGTLMRFAGPRLAQSESKLVPVRLRKGGRTLGGALTWVQPAQLAPFERSSPFHGLSVPKEVLVRRQVLAQPSLDLDRRTWARLRDGTPLVTAETRGDGWLVLFHTTANADWSNLAISGLFVDMLRQITRLAAGIGGGGGEDPLQPYLTLNGRGILQNPPPTTLSLNDGKIDPALIGPSHPPGYYGPKDARRALNLGAAIGGLQRFELADGEFELIAYSAGAEIDLRPWLAVLLLMGLIADVIAVQLLKGWRPRPAASAAAAIVLALLATVPTPGARAQSAHAEHVESANTTRLAFVVTGNNDVDAMTLAGMTGLSNVLFQRTAVEPGRPAAVNIEHDELVFFPMLYWPMTNGQRPPTNAAIAKLRRYMQGGGTIVFDTRDARLPSSLGASSTSNRRILERLLQRLDAPPLIPVPRDHVLTKAFYLLQTFPGRYADGAVWVERHAGGVNDGVSSIIVGANDWAAAWATDDTGRPVAALIPGGARQREFALRFGINMMLYTLTGNYKADQVHIPAILERLGQ